MTQATPTATPLLHGRYRIEEQLGTGRLAVVYRAYDERLQRPVLIHMLRKELLNQEPLRQRFIQEAHLSARRSHQSLLEIYDSGEVAGRPYMITEYVAGRTLRELGALSLEEALLYFRQVVGAVAVCQAAGVAHPPITSNNIILIEDGHVELIENWTTPPSEIALDIACYRAPERTESGQTTHASTVYALALLLLEMLTGRRIIYGEDPRAVAQAHLTTRIPPLSELRPLLYVPALERLLQRATERRPEQRPPDAAALGQALDELRRDITGDTQRLTVAPARPPGLRERLNRTASDLVAARPVTRPRPTRRRTGPTAPSPELPPEHSQAPYPPVRVTTPRRRSLSGIGIVLSMFLVVACLAYYGVTMLASTFTDMQLPRPQLQLPTLPDLGISLPDWLTGVVSGEGEVMVVTIGDVEGLNLRDAPGLSSNRIALLPNGTFVRKLEGPQVVDDIPWLRVRTKIGDQELEGWVSANFVKPE